MLGVMVGGSYGRSYVGGSYGRSDVGGSYVRSYGRR